MTRHQYEISVVVSQKSFRRETSGGVRKCRLFFQAMITVVFDFSSGFPRESENNTYAKMGGGGGKQGVLCEI